MTLKTVCGESATVTPEMTEEWRSETLPELLRQYDPDDVYNADETALFYQCLPNKTFMLKGEKASRGVKESKLRLTVLVTTNMLGNDKVDLLMIGKAAKPQCFKGIKSISLPYKSNSKGWMTGQIWGEWLRRGRKEDGERRNIRSRHASI